jgi:CHASE2 domain-containing sensor protein
MWVEQTDSTPKQTARLMLILATAAITLGATTTAAFYLAFYLIKTLPPLATAAIATITTLKLIQWTIKN